MTYTYSVTNLPCPNCAKKLSSLLEAHPDIAGAKINFLSETLTLDSPLPLSDLEPIIFSIARGFNPDVKLEQQ